jgi:hypothetical protein
MLNVRMIDESEIIWKEVVMAQLTHYPGICLEGPRKTTKTLSQDNEVPAEIETEHFLNVHQECCHYASLFGVVI